MPELAAALTGWNPLHGHCWNPHAVGLSPGGSSSGTGAAIAAGMAPCGLGSDTAGSLRIPADYNGIAGMRPSKCRYSCEGCIPLGLPDVPGPMGLTVADLSLLDSVMAGEPQAATGAPADLKGLKVCAPSAFQKDVSTGTRAALDLARKALEAGGATVVNDEGFQGFAEMLADAKHMFPRGGPKTLVRRLTAYLARHESLAAAGVTPRTIQEKFHWANPILPKQLIDEEGKDVATMMDEDFKDYMVDFEKEKAELEHAFQAYMTSNGFACLLGPICKAPPCNNASGDNSFSKLQADVKAALDSGGDRDRVVDSWLALFMTKEMSDTKFTMVCLDVPSIAIPTNARHSVPTRGTEEASIPAGVLIWGAPQSDRRLLEIGMALEAQLKSP